MKLQFLDLGAAPPSNDYLSQSNVSGPETWYPLRLLVCESCWLVQTEDYAGRETLFSDDYAYFSSYSDSWLEHARNYFELIKDRFGLNSKSMVVEVAANDGYLLQYVKESSIPCYGIEPTASTAQAARNKGIFIVQEFFGKNLAKQLAAEGKQADLLVANNVLAHVPDIHDFVGGFPLLLKSEGICTFEFPHLLKMVQELQFDTAYHEHFSYLSFTVVNHILGKHGLEVFDVEELSTHGGSLRVYAQLSKSGRHKISGAVSELLQREIETGLKTPNYYRGFQERAVQLKHKLLEFLLKMLAERKLVCAYGAAAKGNTLFNFCGIRSDLVSFVVDRNPAKIGKFLPGSRIPIVSEGVLKEQKPDVVLILPWNLSRELRSQLSYVADWGGQLAIAVPEIHILEAAL